MSQNRMPGALSRRAMADVLESLARGVDPHNNQELTESSALLVLQRPTIIRTLFLAAKAMAGAQQATKHAPHHDAAAVGVETAAPTAVPTTVPMAGKQWNAAEDVRLVRKFNAGSSIKQLAQVHGRTERAIAARLVRLGRIDERSQAYLSVQPGAALAPGPNAPEATPTGLAVPDANQASAESTPDRAETYS